MERFPKSSHGSRLHNVQTSTGFGIVLAPKHSGRGLALHWSHQVLGSSPSFWRPSCWAFRLRLALFSCLVARCRRPFPASGWELGEGGCLTPISTAVFTLHCWGNLGPNLSTVLLCSPSNTCYLISLGASQGRVKT